MRERSRASLLVGHDEYGLENGAVSCRSFSFRLSIFPTSKITGTSGRRGMCSTIVDYDDLYIYTYVSIYIVYEFNAKPSIVRNDTNIAVAVEKNETERFRYVHSRVKSTSRYVRHVRSLSRSATSFVFFDIVERTRINNYFTHKSCHPFNFPPARFLPGGLAPRTAATFERRNRAYRKSKLRARARARARTELKLAARQ